MRSRSFSRLSWASSEARSDGNGTAACLSGRSGVPSPASHTASSIVAAPSRATQLTGRHASRKAACGHTVTRFPLEDLGENPTSSAHPKRLSSFEKLAWMSNRTWEDQVEAEGSPITVEALEAAGGMRPVTEAKVVKAFARPLKIAYCDGAGAWLRVQDSGLGARARTGLGLGVGSAGTS